MLIARETIIKALRVEPLEPGFWVNPNGRDNAKCTVCAVGAVLRHAGLTNHAMTNEAVKELVRSDASPDDGDSWEEQADEAIERDDYLAALSLAFEGMCMPVRVEDWKRGAYYHVPEIHMLRIRSRLIKWVGENFPVTFDTAAAQPANDWD